MRRLAGFLALLLLVVLLPSVHAQDPTVQPVGTSEATDVDVTEETYPVLAPDGTEVGTTTWRVAVGTGNCCEHYLSATSEGRIVDFGGTYLYFSDDRGQTWHRVQTPIPYAGGEGAVSAAPDGDVVGVGWSPYQGDHLWAHKYEADEDQWYYSPIPAHSPFHDRPWIAVVPGPIDTDQGEAEYATLMHGFPTHRSIQASLDGLHYDHPTNQNLPLNGQDPGPGVAADPSLDWVQPHQEAQIKPLGDGHAVGPAWVITCADAQAFLDPDLVWRCRETSIPARDVVTDSQGRLHHVQAEEGSSTITYEVSPDDGANWTATETELPEGLTVGQHHAIDWAASGSLNETAVAVHALNASEPAHQDLVLRFELDQGEPRHRETLLLGEGDHHFAGGAPAQDSRFDFASLTMMPDGRLVASFADASYQDSPGLAVEQPSTGPNLSDDDTQAGNDTEEGTSSEDTEQDQARPVARFSAETDGLEATVDASASWDPDGSITAYRWAFGDGTTAEGQRAEHRYDAPGNHTITLTVEDDEGLTSHINRTLTLDQELDPTAMEESGNGIPTAGVVRGLLAALGAALVRARRTRP